MLSPPRSRVSPRPRGRGDHAAAPFLGSQAGDATMTTSSAARRPHLRRARYFLDATSLAEPVR